MDKICGSDFDKYTKTFWEDCLNYSRLITPWGSCTLHEGYWVFGKSQKSKQLHRKIYEELIGDIPQGHVIHHKDYNKWNNALSNLELMSLGEHSSLHNSGKGNPMYDVHLSGEKNHFYGKHHTAETKRKISEANKGKHCGEKNSMFNKRGELNQKKKKQKIPSWII